MLCKVELNKATGITITVQNDNDEITQTVTMDGTAITIKVTDGSNTSTFTQKADSIALDCKTFTLTADTITCSSKTDSTYKSDKTLEVNSGSDMTVESKAKLAVTSTAAMSFAGQATLDVKSAGAMTLKSDAALSGSGTSTTLEGTSKVQVSAPNISVKADLQLDAESSGVANLKGLTTNVQGNLVNLG